MKDSSTTAVGSRRQRKPAEDQTRSRARRVRATSADAKPARGKRAARGGDPLARLRKICLSLPETSEKIAWGCPTFRVRGKMFVMFLDNHHGDGRVAMWCKAPFGVQEALVESDPQRFFVPPYVGHQGWVGMRLDLDVDWSDVAGIAHDAYRIAAPERLAALLA